MSDIPARNQLQEYCQKNKHPLPIYETTRTGGFDHAPLFISMVTVQGSSFCGYEAETKSKAESSAALVALNHKSKKVSKESPVFTKKTALLVDVENLQKFIDELSGPIDNLTVYAFVGEHHCLVDKELPPDVIRVISPSTRPDGTDTCMQVYIGALLGQETYEEYIIATRDHYGSAVVEMITAPSLLWKPKEARLVTKIDQL